MGSTAILSNAVETQTQEVKLANERKTKSLKDALKLKKDSIEIDIKTANDIITAAQKSYQTSTQAKQTECTDETVSLQDEEINLRNIVSELASIQAAISGQPGRPGQVQTKTVTRMVTKNVTRMVTKKVIKIEMQKKEVVVLKQKLEFKGVTAEALNTPEIKLNLEQELTTQLDVQAPSTLSITSIENGNTALASLMEMTASLFRTGSAAAADKPKKSVQINYEIIASADQDNQLLEELEEKMKTLDEKPTIVEVIATEAKVELTSIVMEKPKPIEKKEEIRPREVQVEVEEQVAVQVPVQVEETVEVPVATAKGLASMDVDVEEMEENLAKEVIDVETIFNTFKNSAHSFSTETINNADSEYAQIKRQAEQFALTETAASNNLKTSTMKAIVSETKTADEDHQQKVEALAKSQEDFDQAVINLESAETLKKDGLETATV